MIARAERLELVERIGADDYRYLREYKDSLYVESERRLRHERSREEDLLQVWILLPDELRIMSS
jgi:hypothetical protein